MENWFIPYQTSDLPPAQKVLILAPHPDDEVFGCGGAAALLQQRGASIEVVVLTDGAGFASDEQRQTITQTRQAETNAALAVLGLKPAQFWGIPDRSLVYDEAFAHRIASQLQGVDLVFAPSPTEVHPDHAATARAVLSAVRSMAHQSIRMPTVMFYEVGTPLAPNFLLDITPVWGAKQQAMQCFESQQAAQDYARHIEGLNAFRTYTLNADVRYAEAFFQLSGVAGDDEALRIPTRAHQRTREDLDDLLTVAEAAAAKLHQQLVQHEQWLAERDKRIAEQAAQLVQVSEANKQLETALDQQNHRYEKDVAELRSAMNAQEQVHQSLLNSRSWRLTRPLRWISELLSRRR